MMKNTGQMIKSNFKSSLRSAVESIGQRAMVNEPPVLGVSDTELPLVSEVCFSWSVSGMINVI